MARKTKSSVDYSKSTPAQIMKEPLKQQRAEYTALRDVIQKRLNRIDQAAAMGKFNQKEVADPRRFPFYEYWQKWGSNGRVPKSSDVTDASLPYILSVMKKQIGAYNPNTGSYGWETSTMKGVQEYTNKRLRGLQDAGYSEIDAKNLADFGKFMEMYRSRKLDHITGSPEAAEVYETLRKQGLTKRELLDNFDYYIRHKDDKKSKEEFRAGAKLYKANRKTRGK